LAYQKNLSTHKKISAMDELINAIFNELQDYRADEDNQAVQITPNRIRRWINQFNEGDRIFILTELKNIVEKRYCTKQNAYNFLKGSLDSMRTHYNYGSVTDFLNDSVFLDLQRPNKSQPTLLRLLRTVLHDEYDFNFENCGSRNKTYYIYLDDVLCTGNTLFQDIKTWVNQRDEIGNTNLSNLQDGSIKLVFLYLFIHTKNCFKKRAQFRHQISQNFDNYNTLFRAIEIENDIGSKLDLILPLEDNQPELVTDYQTQIEDRVNIYCDQKSIPRSGAEFYRPENQPIREEFFTSLENRKRFEDIILHKGIRILNAATANIPNLRSLGYSLPALKNFGFGTLAMTWRNIPNNCPIVLWYSGGGFFPLFVKNQTN
jgi:hypothetical protein